MDDKETVTASVITGAIPVPAGFRFNSNSAPLLAIIGGAVLCPPPSFPSPADPLRSKGDKDAVPDAS
jgi:hypothetical protein